MRPPEALFSNETKRQALERANYRCESCGKRGRLEIHHILPIYIALQVYQELPHAALSVLENAACLCPDCHNKEHQGDWVNRDYSLQASVLFGMLEMLSSTPPPSRRVQNQNEPARSTRKRLR